MKKLFGSRAVKHWFSDFPRECKDWDYICEEKSIIRGVEHHYGPAMDWLKDNCPEDALTPDMLYTIKVSHAEYDIFWEKTMFDIQFLKSKECKVIEEFYNLLVKDWEVLHHKKRVNLNVSNEKFFNSAVDRVYPHDYLHKLMMYSDKPMYEKLKRDLSKAWINKDMFFALDKEWQLNTCREESYVIALERWLIPGKVDNALVAYRRALKLLITSASKGWFARYIIENYDVLKHLDRNFYREFLETVDESVKIQGKFSSVVNNY